MRAVILAGGRGRRLHPYTAVFPKPLMPIGDRPILAIVIDQLRAAGFRRVTLTVGHLAGLIHAYFGDGRGFGITIDYAHESGPLGTAGPLASLADFDDDVLVMNGDVLTDLDYGALVAAHRAGEAIATLAVYRKAVHITLGVLTLDADGCVSRYDEKPSFDYCASTGIYCFRPDVKRHLEPGVRCDMPELVQRLLARGERVRAFPFLGEWLDIGRPEDYEEAMRRFGGDNGDAD